MTHLSSFGRFWVLCEVPQVLSNLSPLGGAKIFHDASLFEFLFGRFLSFDFFVAQLDFRVVLESTAWLQEQLVDVPEFQIFFPKESQVRGLACPP